MLLKIGDSLIREESIHSIERTLTETTGVEALYSVSCGPSPTPILLTGAAGAALWDRLAADAIDILAPTGDDRDYDQFRRNGGALSRADWRAKRAELARMHDYSEQWWDNPRNQDYASRLEAELLL